MQELIEKYPGKILDGKTLAKRLIDELITEAAESAKKGLVPKVATLMVGDDPGSAAYLKAREKNIKKIGFESIVTKLGADVSTDVCLKALDALNGDKTIDAIMLQLPLPPQVDEEAVAETLDPEKDIDGIHPMNIGRFHKGLSCHVPNTPLGIIRLLDEYSIELKGMEAVVIGRSNIVGRPMAGLLLRYHATVTICHSRTKDLAGVCRRAELLAVGAGHIGLVGAELVRDGAIVVDIGINYDADGNMRGDVDFPAVIDKVRLISPVPGGIGPMTNATILRNIFELAKRRRSG